MAGSSQSPWTKSRSPPSTCIRAVPRVGVASGNLSLLKMAVEIVDLPIYPLKIVILIFHSLLYVYQRVMYVNQLLSIYFPR